MSSHHHCPRMLPIANNGKIGFSSGLLHLAWASSWTHLVDGVTDCCHHLWDRIAITTTSSVSKLYYSSMHVHSEDLSPLPSLHNHSTTRRMYNSNKRPSIHSPPVSFTKLSTPPLHPELHVSAPAKCRIICPTSRTPVVAHYMGNDKHRRRTE